MMIEIADTPAKKSPTAINCEDPAKTIIDIIMVLREEIPTFFANTPKAKPTGMYPTIIGMDFINPLINAFLLTEGLFFKREFMVSQIF